MPTERAQSSPTLNHPWSLGPIQGHQEHMGRHQLHSPEESWQERKWGKSIELNIRPRKAQSICFQWDLVGRALKTIMGSECFLCSKEVHLCPAKAKLYHSPGWASPLRAGLLPHSGILGNKTLSARLDQGGTVGPCPQEKLPHHCMQGWRLQLTLPVDVGHHGRAVSLYQNLSPEYS